ncbi:MAG: hypothetical protein JXA11_06410 [Phycisphaerae bacterium]|nr:hypothetical protein [Phycisphaerae bacterium]
MAMSRKTRVRKRDGSVEEFSAAKLAGALRRVLDRLEGARADAYDLAAGVGLYLRRTRQSLVSSSAVFNMLTKVLRRVGLGDAAELMELHRTLRMVRRRLLRIRHDDGCSTQWDKSWLAMLAERMWHVSRGTARILAAEIELHLLPQEEREISREEIVELLNDQVSQWGLAEPVPVSGAETR